MTTLKCDPHSGNECTREYLPQCANARVDEPKTCCAVLFLVPPAPGCATGTGMHRRCLVVSRHFGFTGFPVPSKRLTKRLLSQGQAAPAQDKHVRLASHQKSHDESTEHSLLWYHDQPLHTCVVWRVETGMCMHIVTSHSCAASTSGM
jgi:hypothetical protein